MSFVTAHVLDASAGRPAAGVAVTLSDTGGTVLASSLTDDDGRVTDLGPESLDPGTYEVRFASGDHFAVQGVACFHPYVPVVFTVVAGQAHYHVPLLLSPFAYTTYRGS